MLDSFPIATLIGILLGFLSGLGIGGGSLLILWLTSVLGCDIPSARATNLLFFLPAATITSFIHYRQGTLKLQSLLPAILTGSITAAAGTLISGWVPTELLQKLFGLLLILVGIKELCYRERNAK